jgi:hypothetical protein
LILAPFEIALIGQPVSHVWRGYGSALFIEFGNLIPATRVRRDGSVGNPSGEITLMIEWSWRIEKPRSILGGSWSSERRWPGMFNKLMGANVIAVKTFSTLPEIEVSLSNGLRVASFMTAGGQPGWVIICRNKLQSTLGVRRGKLHVEELAPNQRFNPTGHKQEEPIK